MQRLKEHGTLDLSSFKDSSLSDKLIYIAENMALEVQSQYLVREWWKLD